MSYCKTILVAAALGLSSCTSETEAQAAGAAKSFTLSGSGASFPAPLYSTWFSEYSKANEHARVNYTSKGSSGGVKDVTDGMVDFGASDAAMTDEELAAVGRPVRLLPMTAGGVVVIFNLDGVEELRLTRDALAGIYLGEITSWNDRRIADANADVTMPDTTITVVRRADGSGTSYAFTNHLAAISPAWSEGPGVSKAPNWPAGVGGKKNDGVAALVKQTPGAIGYVELSFAASTGLPTAQLQNKAGKFVAPTIASFQAALAGTKLPENMRAFLPDPDGADAYPIVTYTWILAYATYPADKLAGIQDVLRWCLTEGQKSSAQLGYVPLPAAVTERVLAVVDALKAE